MLRCHVPMFGPSNDCQPLLPFHRKVGCSSPKAALLRYRKLRYKARNQLWPPYRVLERFQILNDRPAIVRRERRPNHSIPSGTIFEFVTFVAVARIRSIEEVASL